MAAGHAFERFTQRRGLKRRVALELSHFDREPMNLALRGTAPALSMTALRR